MKKFCLFITIICSCSLCAEWHPCTNPPKKGQLYMKEEPILPTDLSLGKMRIITNYNGEKICKFGMHNGWWDVSKEDLWEWFQEEHSIVYTPSM